MLSGVCPGCGLRADLDVFCVQADANKALAAALDVPAALGGRVLMYLRLFSPPSKTLALGKATRLLTELAEAVKAAQVRRHGVDHAAPQALWAAALDAMLASPPEILPLTNHQYLFQSVWNLAEKAAARQERRREAQHRHGIPLTTPALASPLPADAASVPAEIPASPCSAEAAFSSPIPERRARNAQAARELLKTLNPRLHQQE